ncbi:MAG: 30S ribosomal protein S5 [Sulfolobales archaeon]|nr:30S ribosomal protein S5 [Sulfolobales archaeon]MDW8083186.1 30S ribosomal protein S5 [Sulfolobales archaeon]
MSESTPGIESWTPRTKLGMMVKEGKVVSIREIFDNNWLIQEPEIVDYLLPDLKHEVVNVSIVQKQTDAGEVSRFRAIVVVGNFDGYVGIGIGKAKQLRQAIDKAIRDAKLNIVPVRRGCGSWECSCGEPHSIPFIVGGKSGSIRITLKPAPKGTGLVAGDIAKVILRYAGVKDTWTWSKGETRTSLNFILATYDALKKTYKFISPTDWRRGV